MPETDEIQVNDAAATPRRAPLTRDRIIRTALRIMDEEGVDAVTMRRIGRELGVEAMSLYNHVRSKEDILDGITESVLTEFAAEPRGHDWVEQARGAAHEWRRLLKAHPKVIELMVERKHPMSTLEALRPMEIALGILRRSGLSDVETVQAFHAIGGYLFGFVMMEVGNMVPGSKAVVTDELLRDLPEQSPYLNEMFPHLVESDMDTTFDFGLELILDGIRSKAQGQ